MKLVEPETAAALIPDGATVIFGGSGAGHAVPQNVIDSLARVFTETGRPRDLTTVRVVGIGDFAEKGFSQLALPGLMRRTIGSNLGNEPGLARLVAVGEVEAYSFPQGVLSQLCREIAAGRPGVVTKVGLDTYVDPRHTGGKQGGATEDLVELVHLSGEEWLLYRSFPIDVAVIRGSTIDEAGNLSLEHEAINGEMLAMAMAAHNSGGFVIAQAKELASAGSLVPRHVQVPAALIDYAVLDPHQTQTYATAYSPYFAGQAQQARNGQATYRGNDDLIFTAPAGGPLRRTSFRTRYWKPAVRSSVGEPCRFHDMRHTHVALLIEQGAHPSVIASRLGHTSVRTVLDVYGHLFEGLDRDIADSLEPPSEAPRAYFLPTSGQERVVEFPTQ